MFGRKKKFPLRDNARLVCISEEEYKNLLREEIALKLLTEKMRERNGCFEVCSHTVYEIGHEMAQCFEPTWERAKQASAKIGEGKIVLMKSAVDAWEGKLNGS